MAYTVPKLKDFSAAALEKATKKLLAALDEEAAEVKTEADRKDFRDRWMARKNGVLTQVNDLWLKAAPKDAKREVGQQVNELKKRVEQAIDAVEQGSKSAASSTRLESDRLDITLPGIRRSIGAEHPVIKTMNEIVSVFRNLGYSVQEGPVIETDYYNFEALNFPPNHPARDTQDTLFIANQESRPQRERLLLRTHTSPVQIRTMEKIKPPIRIVIPGKVHRNDPPDASHSPMFHQIEGLAVDTNITFGDLKGHSRSRHESAFRIECEDPLPAVVFSLHRTQRRDDGQLFHLRRQRTARLRALPSLQADWMDRDSGLWHGRSQCVRVRKRQRLRS